MDARPTPSPDALLAHRVWVREVARRLARNAFDADDLEQDTWLAALRAGPSDGPGIRAWFARVARNRSHEVHRGDAHRASREERVARGEATASTASLVEQAEAHRRVVDAVLALPEPLRETVLLRYFEGLPPRDVAARTGAPVETVRTRLKRAAELLREKLGGARRDSTSWLGAIAPLLGPSPRTPLPVSTVTIAGGLAVKAAAKVAVVVLVLAGVAWWAWRESVGGGSADVSAPEQAATAGALPESSPADATRRRARGTSADDADLTPATSASEPAAATAPRNQRPAIARVSGRVLLPDGTPAAGAAVRMPPPYGERWAETGADGRFALDVVWRGARVPVWVVLPGWRAPAIQPLHIAAGDDLTLPDVQLAADSWVEIRGRVRSLADLPVEGAVVKVCWPASFESIQHMNEAADPPLYQLLAAAWSAGDTPPKLAELRNRSAVAGADGRFHLSVPASVLRVGLTARAPRHLPGFVTEFPLDRAEEEVDIALRPLPRARGQVVDAPTGDPVAGAGIGFFVPGRDPPPARTDAAGRFDITAPEDVQIFLVSVEAEGFVTRSLEPRGSDEVPLRILLYPRRPITGRVEMSDGTPVEGAYVWAKRPGAPTSEKPYSSSAYTDADGRFALEYLTDDHYGVTVSVGDRATSAFLGTELHDVRGGTTDLLIVVKRAAQVSGRVVRPDGTPVQGASVGAWRDGKAVGARTDEEGRFVLRGVPPGSCRVTVSPGSAPAIGFLSWERDEVQAGTTDLDVVVDPGESFAGIVVDEAGHPIVGRRVRAVPAGSDGFYDHGGPESIADGDGRFTIRGLRPGAYRLQLDEVHYGAPEWWLLGGESVRSGATDLRLVATAGGSISGIVVDGEGAPSKRDQVWALWTPAAKNGRQVLTDDQGRFELRGLPPGRTYTIVTRHGRVHDIAPGTRNLRLAPQPR